MPIKDPEKRKAYQREWIAKKAAKAPPKWHRAKRTTKALWRVRKGKRYFRAKYNAMIEKLAREGKLEEFRAFHRLTCKDWRSKVALEALEQHRAASIAPRSPTL